MKAASVGDYLGRLDPDKRSALEALRAVIRAAAPGAQECVSYGMPAFRLDGMLVWYGAGAGHCAFYPGATVAAFSHDLAGFHTSKGTIRFQPDSPIPPDLVRRIVQARIAENVARKAGRKSGTGALDPTGQG